MENWTSRVKRWRRWNFPPPPSTLKGGNQFPQNKPPELLVSWPKWKTTVHQQKTRFLHCYPVKLHHFPIALRNFSEIPQKNISSENLPSLRHDWFDAENTAPVHPSSASLTTKVPPSRRTPCNNRWGAEPGWSCQNAGQKSQVRSIFFNQRGLKTWNSNTKFNCFWMA